MINKIYYRSCTWRVVAATVFIASITGVAHAQSAPEIRVAEGVLRGQVRDGVNVFRSIPYATAQRFRAPQPAKAWTGVRDAIEDGPSCPQPATLDPAGKASIDEDCLRLNVFTPLATATTRRPVMVWIHGGGFFEGFGGARQYNPSTLVKEGDVVVVSINYRLGTLGLLATKSLNDANELSGNYAIRDQQAALRWVQKNISAFGGDPGNVTIVGESAGGASVLALVSSPLSKGLFHHAIAQSPPWDSHVHARAHSEQTGAELAEKLGCKSGPEQAACLRRLPVDAILKDRGEVGMVQDPKLLPVDPFIAFRDGSFNRVPLIIGSNLHEGYFSTSGLERRLGHAMTEAEYPVQMKSTFGADADELMKQYPLRAHPSPAASMGKAVGDSRFSCYAELARVGTAKYAPVYGFEMNEPNPVQQQPRQKYSLDNTSYHTSDLAYLFDNDTNGPLTGEAAALGRKMRAWWIQFAKTGSPNVKGLPEWPQFKAPSGTLLNLSNAGGVTGDFATRHNCDRLRQAGIVYLGSK